MTKCEILLENDTNFTKKYSTPSLSRYGKHCRIIAYGIIISLIVLLFTWSTLLLLQVRALVSNYENRLVKDTQNFTTQANPQRLVCYFDTSNKNTENYDLRLDDVPGDLCTHINVGIADVQNATLVLAPKLLTVLQDQLPNFRSRNPNVKILLWIGGGDSGKQFASMVVNHARRKQFLRSLRDIMKKFKLDGVDLDWEFPTAYNKERQHLTQLLYEIRQEWQRERHQERTLTVAVAAPEGIALFAYDITEFNKYVDYVNLMTYDFHFYTDATPFTGLNAPLYARSNEQSILSTININYTVRWWLSQGLEPHRLVVGLPTYGHSFTLVNPFNDGIYAPASGIGSCGNLGFTTYSETCLCAANHLHTTHVFDNQTCSPYLSGNRDWISYENTDSIRCKATFVKNLNVGGVMMFSLNTDDVFNYCNINDASTLSDRKTFPLVETVKRVLNSIVDKI